MDSVLGNLPSYNPHNFSQIRPSDPSSSSVSYRYFHLILSQYSYLIILVELIQPCKFILYYSDCV